MKDQRPLYDRELLLLGAKRNAVLELWEVQRYGSGSYGDTDYVSIYARLPGMIFIIRGLRNATLLRPRQIARAVTALALAQPVLHEGASYQLDQGLTLARTTFSASLKRISIDRNPASVSRPTHCITERPSPIRP